MIDLTKIDELRHTKEDNITWYLLRDFNFFIGYKSYDPRRFLKVVDESNIKKIQLDKYKDCFWLGISLDGINEFIKQRGMQTMKRKYSRTEKENIARRYGWTYGFVEGHIQAGDLDYQIEYAEKYCKPKKKIRRYDMRGFSREMLCGVE